MQTTTGAAACHAAERPEPGVTEYAHGMSRVSRTSGMVVYGTGIDPR